MESKFYGIYRGQVTQRTDTNGKWRIKATVPQISGAFETGWAWGCLPITYYEEAKKHDDHATHSHVVTVANANVTALGVTETSLLSAHSDHVHQTRDKTTFPQQGQGVWIMFEGGDPNKPVWMGVF